MRRFGWLLMLAVGCRTSAPSNPAESDCLFVDNGFGPTGTVPVRAQVIASGLNVPWGMAFLPSGDALITERPGQIRLMRGGQLLSQPVATVLVAPGEEGGLLGIAVHPQFATNRWFYVYATVEKNPQPVNQVQRWRLSGDGLSAAIDRVLLDDIPSWLFHDGGRIRFGPDGMLYVGTGDAHFAQQSQNLETLNGKLLRVTADGQIPPDNPFPGKAVFLLGIRNTEGFDWLDDKTLWVADHGPSGEYLGRYGHDEVNVAKAGDNLGWPTIYGCETATGMLTPALSWATAVPPGGASIYRGQAIPEWTGSLIIGTLGSKHLHRAMFDPANPKRVKLHEVYFEGDPPGGYGRLRDVVMGPDGQLYVTTSNCDGRGNCPADRDKILQITR